MAWTDEQKQEAVDAYEEANPTETNSTEIVKQIAEDMDQSPNGVRMILVKAGVYIKSAPATSTSSGTSSSGTRVSKAASQASLTTAITDAGGEPDDEIISKLTGKAAVYFTGLMEKITA